ncbi:MAG: hypothetical protein WBA53_03270 [Burkholderiaceae bacterium]
MRSDTSGIEVDMTMTTPACPVSEMRVGQARAAVETIAPVGMRVQVNLVRDPIWNPIWNPSMMSGVAREFSGDGARSRRRDGLQPIEPGVTERSP